MADQRCLLLVLRCGNQQVDYSGCAESPYLWFEGQTYTLLQLHIHSASEHTVSGRTYLLYHDLLPVFLNTPDACCLFLQLTRIGCVHFSDQSSVLSIRRVGSPSKKEHFFRVKS